jgi:hypothetical protein
MVDDIEVFILFKLYISLISKRACPHIWHSFLQSYSSSLQLLFSYSLVLLSYHSSSLKRSAILILSLNSLVPLCESVQPPESSSILIDNYTSFCIYLCIINQLFLCLQRFFIVDSPRTTPHAKRLTNVAFVYITWFRRPMR